MLTVYSSNQRFTLSIFLKNVSGLIKLKKRDVRKGKFKTMLEENDTIVNRLVIVIICTRIITNRFELLSNYFIHQYYEEI